MLHQFLQDRLDSQNNQVLIIGEDHVTGGAHQALATEIKKINKNGKKIIFLTEFLPRLQGKEGKEIPYEMTDLKKTMEHEMVITQQLFSFLLSQGVEIYGIESKITAPTTHFVSQDKESLYQEVQKEHPYLLENKDQKAKIDRLFEDESLPFKDFSNLFNSIYSLSDERITIPNKEFSEQVIKIIQEEKNALCILGVGSAHVPAATKLKDEKILDEGIHKKLTDAFADKKIDVSSCFVSIFIKPSTQDNRIYKPREDGMCSYGEIKPCFKILRSSCDFVMDEIYLSKIESRLSELKKTSKWNLYKSWSESVELQVLTDIKKLYQEKKKSDPSQDTWSLREIVATVQKNYANQYQDKIPLKTKELLGDINPLVLAFTRNKKLTKNES